ncbi:LysR family transcriptional regulator [Frondihabitans sp. PAMC 28766]|uniref:LysR family transcriptional regulator n=1 Tax=Frondihabitans sp. PAMC 28766 TaxID=1795630 RepID=UPI0009EAEAAF|nr:LysR family transcriptional regulator [Frondihabitans sp. PAMC 28766]
MTTPLDLLDLRCIRAVADAGTITGAAGLLGYSQPAVTQRLRRAERLLGQPLVLRSGRGVTLTEAGRRLARHAVHVQAALDAAEQDLDDLLGGSGGTVRLAGFPSASSTLVPAILSSLRITHPNLVVSYVEAEPPEAMQLLREGAVDLALTFTYPGDARSSGRVDDDGVVERALFRDTMLLVAPTGTSGELADLRDQRFIGGCPRCRGHLLASCRAAGFEPDIVLETDNALAVTGLVAAGLGVALLPALSLVSAALPVGVDVRAMPGSQDRIVHAATVVGAERVPAVAACLRVLAALDPRPFGLRPAGTPPGAPVATAASTEPVGAAG